MRPRLGLFRALAAAWLVAAAGSYSAAAPSLTDGMLAPLAAAYLRAVVPGAEAEHHRELLGAVLRRVERSYAQEVDAAALVSAAQKALESLAPGSGDPATVFARAVNAALGSLDPHSRYLDSRAADALRGAMRGGFGGLGLQLEMMRDGGLRIVATLPGTPAARAGLRSGDLILRLDGQPVAGMTLEEAISQMRGEPGTSITLTIRRDGHEELLVFPLVRELIRRETVHWRMEGGVLVLRISSFNGTVSAEIEKVAAETADQETPRAIVLDLRGNTGGLLRQAVMTADAFLSAGQIVSLHGRTAANQRSWRADANEHFAGVPMVVLVDSRTASAAELVAAALQDNGRATVMGQRSFGKGSVQSLISLGEGKGALRLTTALYRSPSGRSIQCAGVTPDIELTHPGERSSRARGAARGSALPCADEPAPPKVRLEASHCAPAQRDLDPELACALAFIEAGGIEALAGVSEAGRAEAPGR